METVKKFEEELYTLEPRVSSRKIKALTQFSAEAYRHYKHIVHALEKFILKARPELKVPGLYVIDAIVKDSKHRNGAKDVYGPRFAKNFATTYQNLMKSGPEDQEKIRKVLKLWMDNDVFPAEVIREVMSGSNVKPHSTPNDLYDYGDEAPDALSNAGDSVRYSTSASPAYPSAAPPAASSSSSAAAAPAEASLPDSLQLVSGILELIGKTPLASTATSATATSSSNSSAPAAAPPRPPPAGAAPPVPPPAAGADAWGSSAPPRPPLPPPNGGATGAAGAAGYEGAAGYDAYGYPYPYPPQAPPGSGPPYGAPGYGDYHNYPPPNGADSYQGQGFAPPHGDEFRGRGRGGRGRGRGRGRGGFSNHPQQQQSQHRVTIQDHDCLPGYIRVLSTTVWLGSLPHVITLPQLQEVSDQWGENTILLNSKNRCAFLGYRTRYQAEAAKKGFIRHNFGEKFPGCEIVKVGWGKGLGQKDFKDEWMHVDGAIEIPLSVLSPENLPSFSVGCVVDRNNIPPQLSADLDKIGSSFYSSSVDPIEGNKRNESLKSMAPPAANDKPPSRSGPLEYERKPFQGNASHSDGVQRREAYEAPDDKAKRSRWDSS